ncbi:MAG TPA: HTTM domain-containing protein [Acidimicrobiales bacterium]|nr:HTTM domain-containing protein [Acidimicrobiales bacterium]
MLRILVGVYAVGWSVARLGEHLAHTRQPAHRWEPPGVWALRDAPPPDLILVGLAVGTPVLGLLFVAGWRFRAVAPAFAVAVLVLATLDSSWGQVFHTENLMVLHVGILALAPGAADALAVNRRSAAPPEADGAYGWPVRLCALVAVITYVVAGLAKLRYSGFDWADGSALRNLVAYDNLRKELLGDRYSPLGTGLVGHAWVFPPLAIATLAVELGAWVALLGGRRRTVWVVAAWVFHVGVLALMAILFAYQLSGVAFAPFFRLERLADRFEPRALDRLRLVKRGGRRRA